MQSYFAARYLIQVENSQVALVANMRTRTRVLLLVLEFLPDIWFDSVSVTALVHFVPIADIPCSSFIYLFHLYANILHTVHNLNALSAFDIRLSKFVCLLYRFCCLCKVLQRVACRMSANVVAQLISHPWQPTHDCLSGRGTRDRTHFSFVLFFCLLNIIAIL